VATLRADAQSPGAAIVEIFAEFGFEAAHRLPCVPETHPCARMHGHSYQIRIAIKGAVDERIGWVRDFYDIASAFEPFRVQLDHHVLNEVPGLENPTSEHLARWLWQGLSQTLTTLTAIEVRETRNMGCIYRGDEDELD
jgi:6-pyruvoyltetrahydropterin/6-carboxytetrahydropterin synthase